MDPNRAYIVCETSAATQVEWYVERSFAVSLVKSRHPVIIRNTVSFVLSQKKAIIPLMDALVPPSSQHIFVLFATQNRSQPLLMQKSKV